MTKGLPPRHARSRKRLISRWNNLRDTKKCAQNLIYATAWHGMAWCVYHVSSQRSTKCCVAKTAKTTIPLDFVGEQKAIVLLYLDKHTGRRYKKQFHATHFCSHSQHTRLVFYFFRFFFSFFFSIRIWQNALTLRCAVTRLFMQIISSSSKTADEVDASTDLTLISFR